MLRFDLRASALGLGAVLLHWMTPRCSNLASLTNPHGLALAELLSLSALVLRTLALRAGVQGALAHAHGRETSPSYRTALERYRRTTGFGKSFRVAPQLRWLSKQSVTWMNAYGIRCEAVAFSMASIKVLPKNGFVR